MANFEKCLAFTLKFEGGYVDNKFDPGGATNMGITLATYRAHGHPNATKAELHAMPVSVASAIYRASYWNPILGDALPDGVALIAFDIAVNMGTGRALRYLAETAKLAPRDRILAIHNKRIVFYRSIKTFSHFGKGWTARETACLAFSLSMLPRVVSRPVGLTSGVSVMLTDSKPVLASQTIWGALIALVGGVGGAYGAWKSGDVNALALAISAVFGGLIAVIGRFKATTTLGKTATMVATEAATFAQSEAAVLAAAVVRPPAPTSAPPIPVPAV